MKSDLTPVFPDLLRLSLASACGLLCSAAVLAGGGSYNGPALGGPSIPVSTDRFPTFADLQGTVGYCMAGFGEKLWQQAYRQRPDSRYQRRVEFSFLPERCDYMAAITWAGPGAQGLRNVVLSDNLCDPHFMLQLTLPALPISLPRVPGMSNPEGLTSTESFDFLDQSGLPQFRYEQVIGDDAYDEFGRLANFEAITARNISIQLPMQYGSAVPLRNQTTGHTTSLTANVQNYVECLRSRLQQ